MRKLLITGGSGMLGSYVAAQAAEHGWETWATFTRHRVEIPGVRMLPLDVRDRNAVISAVSEIGPDAVIHTSAIPRPDICEREKRLAYDVNVLGTCHVIHAAESVGAQIVHVSTDLVYSGERSPYRENDTLSPVNYYGLTKASAEVAVHAAETDWAIVRTSTIYGPRIFPFVESYSDKVIEALRSGNPVPAFTDQYRSAVPAWTVADVLLEIADRRLTGIYHAVGLDVVTRWQLARKIAEVLNLDPAFIRPVLQEEVAAIAFRPKILVLDTTATARVLNTVLPTMDEAVEEMARRLSHA